MPEIKTTIDANAPILMQWIISDPKRLKEQAEEGRHPLPNTKTFPHRQRLVNMAKVEPDRLICLYYLGDTLDEKQNKQMEELENLAPNIRVIDFNKLDWSEYDFEFNTSMLSVEDEGENMKMTEYLKLPNTDNRMGFRLDMMRTLMLLKAEKGVIEAGKAGSWNKPIGKGAIFFDFDIVPDKKMGELQAPYGILSGYCKGIGNLFDFFYYATIAVTESKNHALTNACKNIKGHISGKKTLKLQYKGKTCDYCHDYLSFDNQQNSLVFSNIAHSIVDSVCTALPKKVFNKIKNKKELENLIKEDEVGFRLAVNRNGANIIVNNDTIDCQAFHSWVISEDANVNKKDRNNSIYYKIFKAMYKNTELRVEKPATSLNDVHQEQQRENYRRSIS